MFLFFFLFNSQFKKHIFIYLFKNNSNTHLHTQNDETDLEFKITVIFFLY